MISRAAPFALLAAGLLAIGLIKPGEAWAASACRQGDAAWVWTAPLRPQAGEPLDVLAVATDGELDEVLVTDPAGRRTGLRTTRGGGPPWNLHGTLLDAGRGAYRIEATRGGRVTACAELQVGGGTADRGSGRVGSREQALYAAWIEQLFDAPPEHALSFPSLEPVLRDPARNFLYDYLSPGEDQRLPAEPDCADLSYFLRAYFAWKRGLPIAYRACNRGTRESAPRCDAPTIDRALTGPPTPCRPSGRSAGGSWTGSVGQRPNGPSRRGNRPLPRPARSRGALAGNGLRGPLRPHPHHREMVAPDGRTRRAASRGRRAARQLGQPQALLGRDLPLRPDIERRARLQGAPSHWSRPAPGCGSCPTPRSTAVTAHPATPTSRQGFRRPISMRAWNA